MYPEEGAGDAFGRRGWGELSSNCGNVVEMDGAVSERT